MFSVISESFFVILEQNCQAFTNYRFSVKGFAAFFVIYDKKKSCIFWMVGFTNIYLGCWEDVTSILNNASILYKT